MKRYVKMPNRARFRKCPVCLEPKQAREYRISNRNPKRDLICWKCRKGSPNTVKNFYGGAVKIEKPVFDKERFRRNLARLAAHFAKRAERGTEVNMSAVNNQAANYLKFPERVAAIVGKTYSVMGDDFKLSDDEALTRIRDLIDELDPTLIERNKKKRLSR